MRWGGMNYKHCCSKIIVKKLIWEYNSLISIQSMERM
jgi:hypothetical protein